VSNGADINLADNNNSTALHKAATNGNTRLVKKLVAKGADINLRDSDGCTPMDIAMSRGFENLFPYLVRFFDSERTGNACHSFQCHFSGQQAQPYKMQIVHYSSVLVWYSTASRADGLPL
jgi:predicted CxxxxCH...CXXCH cytochrome family protein